MKEKKTLNQTIEAGAVANTVTFTKSGAAKVSVPQLLELILTSLDDSKAEDILTINIEGKTAIADYMIIATGRSHRHVGATTDHLLRDMKAAGLGTAKVEGLPACDWVLVDAGDIIVHVFKPEVREFYNLEKLWLTMGIEDKPDA